jgi:hypothetical protein
VAVIRPRGGDQTSASVEVVVVALNRSVASSAGARHAVPHPGQGPDRGRCVLVEAVDRIGEVIRDADLRGRWAARSSSCWPRRPMTAGSGRGLPRLRLTRLCAGMLPERGWNGVRQSRTPGWTRGHTAGDDSGAMRGTPLRRTRDVARSVRHPRPGEPLRSSHASYAREEVRSRARVSSGCWLARTGTLT